MKIKKDIVGLFKKRLGLKVIKMEDTSVGCDHDVTIVTTDGGKFAHKRPRREPAKVFNARFAYQKCSKKGIPVPRILYYDKRQLVETFIEGQPIKPKPYVKQNHVFIGRILKRIHNIPTQGFGPIRANGKGEFPDIESYLDSMLPKKVDELIRLKYITKEEAKTVLRTLEERRRNLKKRKTVLLHGDVDTGHFIVNKGKISGVIDFGDIMSGAPEEDFHYLYQRYGGRKEWKDILEGYGRIHIDDVEFYAAVHLTWKIASRIKSKRKDARYGRMDKMFRRLTGLQ
jgi:aminoglycoside phosphotransferase (APT) family kinase protein